MRPTLSLLLLLAGCPAPDTGGGGDTDPDPPGHSGAPPIDLCAWLAQEGHVAAEADRIEVVCKLDASCDPAQLVTTTLEAARNTPCNEPIDPGFDPEGCELDGTVYPSITSCWGE